MDEYIALQYLFQTLGDANRLRILRAIGEETKTVGQIAGETGISQPLVSHHLRILRERQLVTSSRKGPFIHYTLTDRRLLDVMGMFAELAQKAYESRTKGSERPAFACPPWAWNRWHKKGGR